VRDFDNATTLLNKEARQGTHDRYAREHEVKPHQIPFGRGADPLLTRKL
jgi:hypothetical protein